MKADSRKGGAGSLRLPTSVLAKEVVILALRLSARLRLYVTAKRRSEMTAIGSEADRLLLGSCPGGWGGRNWGGKRTVRLRSIAL